MALVLVSYLSLLRALTPEHSYIYVNRYNNSIDGHQISMSVRMCITYIKAGEDREKRKGDRFNWHHHSPQFRSSQHSSSTANVCPGTVRVLRLGKPAEFQNSVLPRY